MNRVANVQDCICVWYYSKLQMGGKTDVNIIGLGEINVATGLSILKVCLQLHMFKDDGHLCLTGK